MTKTQEQAKRQRIRATIQRCYAAARLEIYVNHVRQYNRTIRPARRLNGK